MIVVPFRFLVKRLEPYFGNLKVPAQVAVATLIGSGLGFLMCLQVPDLPHPVLAPIGGALVGLVASLFLVLKEREDAKHAAQLAARKVPPPLPPRAATGGSD